MRLTRSGGFRHHQRSGVEVFDITAAPPSWVYFSASIMLSILFGVPTIVVLLNSARRDVWSLAAAMCGVLVLGLSLRAAWRALAGRGLQQLRLTVDGIAWGRMSTVVPWHDVARIEVLGGSLWTPAGKQRPSQGNVFTIGAAIAAQQQASDLCLVLQKKRGGRPVVVATGLDAATAYPLCDAVAATAADLSPSAPVASSRDEGC